MDEQVNHRFSGINKYLVIGLGAAVLIGIFIYQYRAGWTLPTTQAGQTAFCAVNRTQLNSTSTTDAAFCGTYVIFASKDNGPVICGPNNYCEKIGNLVFSPNPFQK
jgi:hypothetical protein